MKKLKILFMCLIMTVLCGCSSDEINSKSSTKYNYDKLSFIISNDFDVSEETYGLIVDGDGWKVTFKTVELSTSTDTMNSWQGYLSVAKSIHPNIINTSYIGQEAIQYIDTSLGAVIETYLKSPNSAEMIRITLFDEKGNHEELLDNKDVVAILNSCEVK